MAIVTGMRSTTDLSTQRLTVDIGAGIALLDPNENPLTLLTSMVGTVEAKQPKHSHLEDILQPEVDTITTTLSGGAADTAVVVDNISYYSVGDIWQVHDSYELIKITDVNTATNTITVARNYPGVASGHTGYPSGNLTDGDYLIRIGNVNEEGSLSPVPKTTVETQVDNYTQIFKTPFELTETELQSLMEGEADLPYQTRKKGIEHARAIEYASIWGIPGVLTGANGKPERMMGGLWWYLKENAAAANLASQAEITAAEFLTWLRAGFRYGSSKKVLLACPLVLSAIESWGYAKLNTFSSDKTFGINITNWTSPHGDIAIINHKMLEGPLPGTAGGWAFLLDMEKIKRVYLRGRDTKLQTNIQENDRDSYKAQYLSEVSLEVKNPNCHGVLYNVTTFAA